MEQEARIYLTITWAKWNNDQATIAVIIMVRGCGDVLRWCVNAFAC